MTTVLWIIFYLATGIAGWYGATLIDEDVKKKIRDKMMEGGDNVGSAFDVLQKSTKWPEYKNLFSFGFPMAILAIICAALIIGLWPFTLMGAIIWEGYLYMQYRKMETEP